MKKIITMLIFAALFVVGVMAQTPQYYNRATGGSSNNFPFNMAAGKAVNWLILNGELSQPSPCPAGEIYTLWFRMGAAGTHTYTTFQILMAQSSITTLTTGTFYPGPWDTVYNQPSPTLTSTAGGWMSITLDKHFTYDPNQSLVLFVGQCGESGSGNMYVQQSSMSGVLRVWSVGGCPFTPYASGDASSPDFGVDISGVGINQYNSQSCQLMQNYPDPFNQNTIISYQLKSKGDVVLKVYDIMGKEVTTLVNANQDAGKYEVKFDATNLAPGMYVYQLTTNNFSQSKRMMIEK